MFLTRPELELKRRAPLIGGQPGTHEFVRGARFIVSPEDTADFIVVGNAEDEIQAALNALTAGRTWMETVKVRGDLTIGSIDPPILQPDYSLLDLTEAKFTLADGGSDIDQGGLIENDDPTNGNSHLGVLGGFIDLNRANQTVYSFGIKYDKVANFFLEKQVIWDSYGSSIELRGVSHDGRIAPTLLTTPRDDCLSIRDGSHDVVVRGGEYSYASGLAAPSGIEIEDGAHDITVIAPHIHHCNDGLLIESTSLGAVCDIEVIRPHSHHNDAMGIHIYNPADAVTPVDRVTIRGPRTHDNGASGIYVQGVAEKIITNVKILDIISMDEAVYNLVTGYCRNVQMKAVHLSGAGTRPYQRGAGSINTMVGNRELWLYNVFMETVGATQRTLDNDGRCYLVPVQVKEGCVMSYYNLLVGAVTAGSIRCGIYRDAGFIPDAGALLDEQWLDATTFTVDQVNRVNMTDIWLPSGIYWLVIQSSATTLNVFGHDGPATMALGGLLQTRYFDQAWGTFPAVCPATTLDEEIPDYVWIEKA